MIRKLKAIWKIITADQFKLYAYRFSRIPEDSEYMRADYACYIFSDNTDAVNRSIKDYNWK